MEQLSVNLALDTIYVHGTVNGAEADFELTAPGVWAATVPRAPDGRYEVEITAYNSLGTPITYSTVIVKLDELLPFKTDWRASDYYNFEDLNRVEANTDYLREALALAGYLAQLGQVNTGRSMESLEVAASLARIEANIDALHQAFIALPGYEEPKEWTGDMPHDYRDANRVERNLALLNLWLGRAVAAFRPCGTFFSGEGGEIY